MAEENSSEVVKEQSEVVAASNLKVMGEGPAFFQNQMYAQAVNNAASWNQLNQAVVSKASEMILNTSANSEGADIAALGMLIKALVNTPPTSGQNT
jgi:hypothetical protein